MPLGSQEIENKAMLLAFDPDYNIPEEITSVDRSRIRARADIIISTYERLNRANRLSTREIQSKAESLAHNSTYTIPRQVFTADREIIERMAAAIRAERGQPRSRARSRSGSRSRSRSGSRRRSRSTTLIGGKKMRRKTHKR